MKIINIDCSKNKTAYDCLKSECDYAEADSGAFYCNKPKGTLFGKRTEEG